MDLKSWHYTYYSYERGGRGYIGKRTSKVPPDEDPYLGSFSDKTFRPTDKIVIAIYDSAKKALRAESALQQLFCAHKAEHFANRAIYPLGKFGCLPKEERDRDASTKQEDLEKSSRRLLELDRATTQSDLEEWIPLISIIHRERQCLVSEGKTQEMQVLHLLRNPYGVTFPVADLQTFCDQNRLSIDRIQELVNHKINSWNGWTRGDACFPWNE